MGENRSRFVLLCQQSLALALVTAIAAPAANLVTLDIVAPPVGPATPATRTAGVDRSVVATHAVRPSVSTVPLAGVSKAGLRALRQTTGRASGAPAARLTAAETDRTRDSSTGASAGKDLAALSAPQTVDGLATVGVTWAHGVHVPDQSIVVSVRTRTGSVWSGWTKAPYHEEEGPDPASSEGRASTPGTDPVYVGQVDDVQVRALTTSGQVPEGMRISLVDPGQERASAEEQPAIDTSRLDGSAATTDATSDTSDTSGADATLSSSLRQSVTSKPKIYSRAQWGADERMRSASSLHYGEVHGGFVHHTVNANTYSRAQVPALIRGIYAYHTQSRGWSDVGYNFLVDRFGRIWEGRYGGVDRPVVGAHTLGYNDDAFAMSAIGNYDITRPSSATVRAFGRLFAWKLSLHGVRAGATHQWIEKRYLPAIDGHRDVGQTACPGRYLYAKIPEIRRLAARAQESFGPRSRATNLVGIGMPDLVVRDRVTHRVSLVRTASDGTAGRVTATGTSFDYANRIVSAGDWNGDGHPDVITRSGHSGLVYLYRGDGRGHFAEPARMSSARFGSVRMLAGVGDMTGDGHPDLMGQPKGGSMRIYPGTGHVGLRRGYVAHSNIAGTVQLGVNLWNSDGSPDVVIRRTGGTLMLYPGNGPGGLTGGSGLGVLARGYEQLTAPGDLTGDGRVDLVARSRATGRLWMLPGSAKGFGPRRAYAGDMSRYDLIG